MAGISLIYNSVDLSQWFDVTDVQRNIGTSHVNSMAKIGQSDGQLWQYMSRDAKTITISGIVTNANLAKLRRDLGAALDVDEPAQLVIGDDTGVYYLAIYDGQPTIAEDWRSGTISLTFIVPDGVAHSLTTTTVSNASSGGTVAESVDISNAGSYKTYPVINVTMSGDNGYIGLANSAGGYLEFGNSEEVDGVTLQKTEHALALGLESAPSGVQYNVGATNYPNYAYDSSKHNVRQGSITYGSDPVGGTAALPTFINGSYWAGPSLYVPISANSAGSATGNFSYTARGIYNTNKNAMGRLEQVLQSGSNVAFESVLRDSANNADQIVWEVWIQNTLVKSQSLNRKNFANNKYIQTQITKIGPSIKFALGAVSKITAGNIATVTTPLIVSSTRYDLAGLSIDGWSSWFERWQGNEHVLMSLSDVRFDWINVDYWVDEPNRWAGGDVVTIDTRNKQVLTNGVPDMNLNTVGNHWDDFYLAPGDNNIQIGYSSWANAPQVEINWEEAFV